MMGYWLFMDKCHPSKNILVEEVTLGMLLYADDAILLAANPKDMQRIFSQSKRISAAQV